MAVDPQVVKSDYAAADTEKSKLAPGVAAYQPPKVTAAPKVSNPNGAPSFWQRIQADGVMMAKKVADTAKDTVVSTGQQVGGAVASVSNTELRHTGSGELDNAIKAKFGANPVQGFLESGGKKQPLGAPYSPKAIQASKSVGQKIESFIGTPNKEQTIGNFINTALLIGTPLAGKGVKLGGEFLIEQLGKQGVQELATKAGIDATKTTIEDAAQKVAQSKVGKGALKALSTPASNFVTRALKAGAKAAPATAVFSGASAMSAGGNAKQVAKSAAEGIPAGIALGAGGSLIKSGFNKVSGKTDAANIIRTQAKTHVAAEKNANERGLPQGETTKQIPAGSKTVKQLGAGGKQAEGKGFTMSDKPNPEAIAKSKQIDALQTRITQFQQGKLKITPEEAKSDSTQLKLLKSNAEKPATKASTSEVTAKPKMASLKSSTDKTATPKLATKMNESGAVKPGQAGADIKNMIDKHNESTAFSKDIQESSDIVEGKKNIVKSDAAKIIKGRAQLTNDEKTELQKYRDSKAAGLTPKPLSSSKLVKEDADVTELNKASQAADAQRARLAGNESKAQAIEARDPSTYTHRVAQGKGSSYDYVAQGDRKSVVNSGLQKSKSGDKSRVMYNLTDENGNRHTVSIKNAAIKDKEGATVKRINKQVTEFTEGGKTVRSLGSMNMKTDEERMQKELDPIQKNIDNLTNELRMKTSTKSLEAASTKRLENIRTALSNAQDDKATVLNKYDMNELDGKTFKAKDGHTYTFSQATVDEIQKNSGQKYYVDPKLNAVANYVDSKTALENSKFIEQIKTSPKVEDFVSKPGETAPPGFKSVPNLPQFQGYKFDPKTADVLKDIVGSKDSEPNILNRVGRFLRQTVVYFPVKHDLNMAASYTIDRGISKLASPLAYKRMVSSLYAATQDVMHQSDFYQQVQKKGFQLVSAENGELDKAFSSEIKGLLDNKAVLDKVAQQVGSTPERLGAAYKSIQQVMVWQAQDILNIARIRERMTDTAFTKGESLDDAIENTAKFNLQYKVPSRVAGSRQLSRGLQSDVVFFGTYRYDLYRTFTNILKGAVNVKDPKGAAAAWDKLAATAVGVSLVMPFVNKEIQKITGDPNAHMSAPGGLNVPSDITQLLSGKETPGAFASSQLYLSSAYTTPYALLNNNKVGTTQTIYNPYASGKTQVKQIGEFLLSQLSPVQKLSSVKNTTGNKVATWVLSLSGASTPKDSPDLNKYYSLAYDQASPTYDAFRSQVQSGNTKAAIQTADQYNNQLVTSLQKAWEDNNPGKNITTQEVSQYIQGLYNSPWIDTSQSGMYSAKQPSKSILQKIK